MSAFQMFQDISHALVDLHDDRAYCNHSRAQNMTFLIIQSWQAPRTDWTMWKNIDWNHCYAKRHGYSYLFDTTKSFAAHPKFLWAKEILEQQIRFDASSDAHELQRRSSFQYWFRLLLLGHVMDTKPHTWYLWLDADAVVQHTERKLEDVVSVAERRLSCPCNLIAQDGELGINTGVLLLRHSPQTRRLIERWLEAFFRNSSKDIPPWQGWTYDQGYLSHIILEDALAHARRIALRRPEVDHCASEIVRLAEGDLTGGFKGYFCFVEVMAQLGLRTTKDNIGLPQLTGYRSFDGYCFLRCEVRDERLNTHDCVNSNHFPSDFIIHSSLLKHSPESPDTSLRDAIAGGTNRSDDGSHPSDVHCALPHRLLPLQPRTL